MSKQSKYFLIFIILFLIFIVFKQWFLNGLLSGGDFAGSYPSLFVYPSLYPYAWYWNVLNGLGGFSSPYETIYLLYSLPFSLFTPILHFNVSLIDKIGYFYPFLLISGFSIWFGFKYLFSKSLFGFIAVITYIFNTYALMITGGGQVTVMLGYAIVPVVLAQMIRITNEKKFKKSLILSFIAGLLLAIQVLFDIRFVYITLFAGMLYIFFYVFFERNVFSVFNKLLIALIIPLVIAGLLHSFWLLPAAFAHQNPIQQLGGAYDSAGAVQFFSFAKFENTFGLLHPNWPENIFGFVHFMQPEFIVLPILAFGALFFLGKNKTEEEKKENVYVIYFALLALVGIFLAKGANDPFGGVYIWLFNHVPGFIMFRDPTKWYALIAVSYATLIPYTLWKSYEWFTKKFGNKSKIFSIQNVFILVFILFWMFTIRQAVLGKLTGTFKPHTVPVEYTKLESFLNSQDRFSRTFWVPSQQRYGFYSSTHPAISGENFYNVSSVSGVIDNLKSESTEKTLQDAAVKYVIVPYDSEGELFVTDRKYDNKMYMDTVASISAIPWLTRINGFGKIAVFQIPNPRDHFWLITKGGQGRQVSYSFINPTEYTVKVQNVRPGDRLVFSESYDKNWEITNPNVVSQKYEGLFNSFVLPQSGSYALTVEYGLQKWVVVGLWISIASAVIVITSLISLQVFFRKKSS